MRTNRISQVVNAKPLLIMVAAITLSACAEMTSSLMPEPLEYTRTDSRTLSPEVVAEASGLARSSMEVEEGISVPMGDTLGDPYSRTTPPPLDGQNISVSFEGLLLPAFINTVFGELLSLTFEIDDAVMSRGQLVTLRTAAPISPHDFYTLAVQVLENYGITVVYRGNVYRVVESVKATEDIPRIIRTRALSTVPDDMRPVFYYRPLHNSRLATMQTWLQLALARRVQVISVPGANGLMLIGNGNDVAAALEIIQVLDHPVLAGTTSVKIAPAYWSAPRLAQQLSEVLSAEGYNVGIGGSSIQSIRLLPIEALNIIIVFSTDQKNLNHVIKWAKELDQPGQTVGTKGIYYHQVNNTNAEELAEVVTELLSRSGTTSADQTEGESSSQGIIVDKSRNAIIYNGSAEGYSQFRSLMLQMDRAPLEVLIEATVAELTLDEGQSLGFALNFDDGSPILQSRTSVTSDEGLSLSLIRNTGNFSAAINSLADEQRVHILSTPRIIASSGTIATINVGTQVPIITTQQTAPSGAVGGTSNILQDVQYRDTGVLLQIEPIVNSSRRVELTITQEVSEAQSNDTSDLQSPIILTRNITTTLSLDDGETVLLGGLISENFSTGETGIPFLKDIPILGNLFKNQSQNVSRTELIVLLTPYIIDGPETARAVRDAFRDKLGDWAQGSNTEQTGEYINDTGLSQ